MKNIEERIDAIVNRAKESAHNKKNKAEIIFDEVVDYCLSAIESSKNPYYIYITIPEELSKNIEEPYTIFFKRIQKLFKDKLLINYSTFNGTLDVSIRVQI